MVINIQGGSAISHPNFVNHPNENSFKMIIRKLGTNNQYELLSGS